MKLTEACETSSGMSVQTELYAQGNYIMLLLPIYIGDLTFQDEAQPIGYLSSLPIFPFLVFVSSVHTFLNYILDIEY